jgi:hypothetical protein
MFQKIINFIKYHNAFAILFVAVFFGFGMSYAAIPEVRDSVYSSKETVVSIDNGLIVSADLDNYSFNLRVNSVTEDEKNYYASYTYQTLAIQDSVWQNVEIEKTLTVDKEALEGKDLGLYVAQELGENINYERSYLKRVQKLEKQKGESQKVVAVEYLGLIGKLLNPTEKVINGYNPVIPEITATPTPTPEENPVIQSTPEPTPVIILIPTPESTPETTTTPTPEATLTPELTPTPAPEPTPEITPTPTPTPTPESTPTPTPTPEVTTEPTPAE